MNEKWPILKYFAYSHLPPHLQEVSRPFGELAKAIAARAESARIGRAQAAETATALRKLLESKDAAVRAIIPDEAP